MSSEVRPRAAPLWFALGLVITAGLSFVLALFDAADADLGFHLATGRAILASGHILDRNVLSFAEPDHPWVLQQGVPAVLFELLWQRFGVAAVIVFKAFLVAATYACVFATAVRLGACVAWAVAASALGIWAAAFRFVERPLLFSNLAVAVVGWCLARAFTTSGRSAVWFVGAAAFTTAAACHLHAGAVFCFALLLLAALACALEPHRSAQPFMSRATGTKAALLLCGAAAASALLAAATLALYHPHPLRVLEVPFVMGADAYLAEHLIEFRAPLQFPLFLLKGHWLLLAACALLVHPRRVPLPLLAPVLAFAFLSLRFVRFIDLFAVVAAPVLAVAYARGWTWPRVSLPAHASGALAGALALVTFLDQRAQRPFGLGLSPRVWPQTLFHEVERHNLRGPAFVSDGWAGPWLARFYPGERVFFFPAFDAFSPGLYRTYMDIRYGTPGFAQRLDEYGVQLCLLKYTSPGEREFQAGAPNLRQRLAADPAWALVAFDDFGEVFVRRTGWNADAAARLSLPADPDRSVLFGPPDAAFAAFEAGRARGLRSARFNDLWQKARAALSR